MADYTSEYSGAEIDQHLTTGKSIEDLAGIVKCDGNGNIAAVTFDSYLSYAAGKISVNTDALKVLVETYLTQKLIPVGSLIWSLAKTAPAGYLVCDGSNVSRTDYAKLFAAIGTTYGTGDGSSTFGLPNLINKFLEGASTAGTNKSAGLPDLRATFQIAYLPHIIESPRGAFFTYLELANAQFPTNGWSSGTSANFSAGLAFNAGAYNSIYGNSSTVQPPALTALPCIKY